MKFKKILFTVILAAVVSPAFSCWYEATWMHTDVVHAFNNASYFYLAGVNADANHISDISISASEQTLNASYTVANNAEVHLPLTVYVGKKEAGGGGFAITEEGNGYDSTTHTASSYDSYQATMIFTLQYRVLPGTTWHTAAVKRFAFSYAQLMSRKKLFGGFQLDFSAAPGATVLIRLHIAGTVNQKEGAIERTYYRTLRGQGDIHDEDFASAFRPYGNWWNNGYEYVRQEGSITSTTVAAENFDPSVIVYRTAAEVPASRQVSTSLGGSFTGGFTQPYLGYDAYVMAVKIASTRRPGK